MKISVTQLQRRGLHVMFSVMIEDIEGATRNKEVMDRRQRKITGWEKTDEKIPHTWAYVDGYWNGNSVILNPVVFSGMVHWPEQDGFREVIQDTVYTSEHMKRVTKTLSKLTTA